MNPVRGTEAEVLELAVFAGDEVVVHPLAPAGSATIGRSEDNDVRIDHPSVSRHHAVLHLTPALAIEDLGGKNGTYLLSAEGPLEAADTAETIQVSRRSAPLRVGELLTLGTTTLVLRRGRRPVNDARNVPPSDRMRSVLDQAQLAAHGLISVLLLGETGVGKEVMARTIHRLSPRAGGTFLGLNCAALSESLLESELFGHEKGSFTGALQARPGLFEAAEGGTLFLDEVGELPMSIQVKLLRVLEERQVLRVGARVARKVDVRFISATNRDLRAEVERGTFREDLYYRLDGITLSIPPLRHRVSEIGPLAALFAEEASRQMERSALPSLSREALALLERYPWPGNIRELRNAIERAVVLCRGGVLLPSHFPERITSGVAPVRAPEATPEPDSGSRTSVPVRDSAPPSVASSERIGDSVELLEQELEDAERRRVIQALERCQGNQTKAAALLGISRTTLVARLEEYGLPRPRKKS